MRTRSLIIPHTGIADGKLIGIFPAAAYCLKAACAPLPCIVDVLNPYLELSHRTFESMEAIGQAILALFDPADYDLIGLSTMGITFPLTIYLAESLKQRSPRTCVVLGGPHVSFLAQEVLQRFSFIDAVVVGEGERSFEAMMRSVAGSPTAWQAIRGVAVRNAPFVPAPLISNLDTLPILYYADIRRAYLDGGSKRQNEIEGMRGCHAQCRFCSTTQFWRQKVRRKSANRLIQEMIEVAECTGLGFFHILGDNFTSAIRLFRELCRRLIELNLGFEWACSCRIGDLQASDIALMKAAGCTACFVGLESASPQTLERINKKVDLAQTLSNIETAVNMDMDIFASQIVGFPWETKADLAATLKQHTRLLDVGVRKSILNALTPLAGAEGFPAKLVMDPVKIRAELPAVYNNDFTLDLITRHPGLFSSFGHYETTKVDRGYVLATIESASQISAMKG